MKNLHNFKKEITLLLTGLLLAFTALFLNINNPSWARTLESEKTVLVEQKPVDPAKDFESLDNYLTYSIPMAWIKTGNIDKELGNNTHLKLTSPDFISHEPAIIESGVGIVIDRLYDPKSEESLTVKLNKVYEFDTYNVMPTKIDNKNAMTMHKDSDSGHMRFIYIASGTHLWQLTISSKSLEDEQKYQGEIENFLTSIKFKN
mgnify:CR=1 FL=1